jgi:hypothetical protein
MSDIFKEFGVDLLCPRYAGPTAAEVRMEREIARVRAEVLEQARLLGMSAEREAKLRARVEVLERACRLIQADPDPCVVQECSGCYRHSRIAYHALEAKP